MNTNTIIRYCFAETDKQQTKRVLDMNSHVKCAKIYFGIRLYLLFVFIFFTSCTTTGGGLSLFDEGIKRSPESQRIMNEAIDKSMDSLNIKSLKDKSVEIIVKGSAGMTSTIIRFPKNDKGISEKQRMEFSGMTQALMGPSYIEHTRAVLERKLSSLGARTVEGNADAQLVVNINQAGLNKKTYYIPCCLIGIDTFQDHTYWAIFDATIDIKTGDGTRILQTQEIKGKSGNIKKSDYFALRHRR